MRQGDSPPVSLVSGKDLVMAKAKTKYICIECGYESPGWLGKCPECLTFGSISQVTERTDKPASAGTVSSGKKPQSVRDVQFGQNIRYDTGIEELNRVLGGGLVKGSLTLISGDPGIGKSTLLLQSANSIAQLYGKALYVSGEESEEQIKLRAERLGTLSSELYIVTETDMNVVEGYINDYKPSFVVIDSIQTMYNPEIPSAPGSIVQVRECAGQLMKIGKAGNIPIFIVAHVTKQGEVAGPRLLEHMVDTVLTFEGERFHELRILRAVKNRFGRTSEIAVFSMEESGLAEIKNPSAIFLEARKEKSEGTVVVGCMEGTRPILVELQVLVSSAPYGGTPRRTAVGMDRNRLNLIIAVFEKKLGIPMYQYDVYTNVIGGLNIEDTSADLGTIVALYSSLRGQEVETGKLVVIGEVGLTGEVRPVNGLDKIVREAYKMGFTKCLVPKRNLQKTRINESIELIGVDRVQEVLDYVFK